MKELSWTLLRVPNRVFQSRDRGKYFTQSFNPDGLNRPISILIIQFCLSPFPKCKRVSSLNDDFLNQHCSV